MANYLNKPLASEIKNNYISQFVPLPLEIFARANERDQKTQDDYVAKTEEASDALWKVKGVAPDDQQYVDTFKQGFSDAASKLVNKDLTQAENQDQVKSLIKNTSRDKDLNHIMAVSSQYQTAQETRSKMMADNTYNRFNDVAADSYEDYVKSGGYKSGKGLSTDIIKYEDTRPAREKLVDDMRANGNDIVAKFGETFYNNGYEGISKSQAYNAAKSSLTEYMQTNAGAQDAREFRMMQRNNPKNKELQKMDEGDYIFSKILTAANERVFSKTTSGLAEAKNKEKKDKEEAANLGTFLTQGANPVLTGGYTYDYNEDGTIKGEGQSWKSTWAKSTGIFDFIKKVHADNSFNQDSEKDRTGYMLQAAAKLNGMTPKAYVEMKAGPDVKLSTTYKTLPTKTLNAYNQQFYDMTRNTGVFESIPVMNIKTGEKGSMGEILRQMSDRGELLDKKGDKIEISKNATAGEIKNALDEMGTGVIGEQAPNYFSPKSMVVGVGTQQLSIDRTYGGKLTDKLIKSGELSLQQVKDFRKEAIKAAPIIENGYIHYMSERDIPALKIKKGDILKEKLNNLKD